MTTRFRRLIQTIDSHTEGNPTRVLQLLVGLVAITALFIALGWGYLLLFIAILFAIVMLHELGHYLDYSLLKLGDSYHSGGFFKRESFLVRVLYPSEAKRPSAEPDR